MEAILNDIYQYDQNYCHLYFGHIIICLKIITFLYSLMSMLLILYHPSILLLCLELLYLNYLVILSNDEQILQKLYA